MEKAEILQRLQKIHQDIIPDWECWENEFCPCCALGEVISKLEVDVNGSS